MRASFSPHSNTSLASAMKISTRTPIALPNMYCRVDRRNCREEAWPACGYRRLLREICQADSRCLAIAGGAIIKFFRRGKRRKLTRCSKLSCFCLPL